MQPAERRTIASVGSWMVGSGRRAERIAGER
jgi:hypothetical protein